MIVGKKKLFAIEYEIKNKVDDWILGQFRLWVSSKIIGDWDDDSVDLKGCFKWLPTLMEEKVNRSEPALENLNGEQVIFKTFDAFYSEDNQNCIVDSFSRFHISHIGMSSFDGFDIVLLEEAESFRFVWRDKKKRIFDEKVSKKEVHRVLKSAQL